MTNYNYFFPFPRFTPAIASSTAHTAAVSSAPWPIDKAAA